MSFKSDGAALKNKLFYNVLAEATMGRELGGSDASWRILSLGKLKYCGVL